MGDFYLSTTVVRAWAPYVLVIATILWVFFWFKIWQKYGKEHKGIYFSGDVKMPPSKLPPAIVEALLSQGQNVTNNSFVAAIFDLARRNIITIESQKNELKGYVDLRNMGPYKYILHLAEKDVLDNNNFLPHEAMLINFIFSQADDHKTIGIGKLSEIKLNDPENFKNVIADWLKQVEKDTGSYDFIEPESKGWRNIFLFCNIIFIIFIFVMSVIVAGVYESIRFIHGLLALGPVAAVINGNLFLRWNKSARGEVLKWEGFKRYLEDMVYFKGEVPHGAAIWEDVFVYGMVLGINKTVSEYIQVLLSQPETVMPSWFIIGSEDGRSIGFDKLKGSGAEAGESLAASLADMSRVFTDTFSLASIDHPFRRLS